MYLIIKTVQGNRYYLSGNEDQGYVWQGLKDNSGLYSEKFARAFTEEWNSYNPNDKLTTNPILKSYTIN